MSTARCRTCQAPIHWAVTEKGKRIPVEIRPTTDGALVLLVGDGGLFAHWFNEEKHRGMERYNSHFQACPNATEWRNP